MVAKASKYVNRIRESAKPMARGLDADSYRNLQLTPHLCLAAMHAGTGRYWDWNMLAVRCNVGNCLANQLFDFKPLYGSSNPVEWALKKLTTLHARYQKTGKYELTPVEYKAVALGLWVTDEIQARCTIKEWSAATVYIFQIAGAVRTPT